MMQSYLYICWQYTIIDFGIGCYQLKKNEYTFLNVDKPGINLFQGQ
jgi:hypothetical protein